MTNPDLISLANELDDIETDAGGKCNWSEVATVSSALRRLASSDSGVKGEPEPVAWVQPGKLYQYADDEENGNITAIDHQSGPFTMPLYAAPPADAGMRWRHKARGSTYTEIGRGKLQTYVDRLDHEPVVVYRADSDGSLWVRTVKEFEDGRFEALTAPGATTKSDGGEQPPRVGLDWKLSDDAKQRLAEINAAIVRPGDPRLATVIGGGTDFCGHHVMKSLCPTCSPSPSDPSSTRSEVTVESLADWLNKRGSLIAKAALSNPGRHSTIDLARAMLDQFEIRRK